MKKIQIPPAMLGAGFEALQPIERQQPYTAYAAFLEAALRWLSENPIVPTQEVARDLMNHFILPLGFKPTVRYEDCFTAAVAEWQRLMFLAEPSVPEEIRDLLRGDKFGDPLAIERTTAKAWDEAVIEAYRRGKESK